MKKLISLVLCIMVVASFVLPVSALVSVKIKGVKLEKTSITLTVGDTSQLNVTLTPINTTQKHLTFNTSDKNVVSVDAQGTIKAIKAGKAVITITSVSNKALTVKCTVTVKKKEPVTLTVEVFDRGNVGGTPADNNYWTKWIQKQFGDPNNIKLKFVTAPRFDEVSKLNIWMASNQAPDLSITYDINTVYSYYKNGGLTDITDAMNTYAPELKKFLGKDVLDRGKYYGKQYSVPAKRIIEAKTAAWIRQDWLDALGLPTPTTTNEFYYVMREFKAKNPGNVKKVIPFAVTRDIAWVASTLLESFKTDKSEESRYLCKDVFMQLLAPGYKEGMKFLNKMYNEGLMSTEFALDKDGKLLEADMANGSVGSYIQNYDMPLRPGAGYIPTLKGKIPGFNFVPADPFKDKDGLTTKSLYDPAGLRIIVPKTSEKKVKEAMQYLNWMANKDVIFFLQYGEEGVGHIIKNGMPIYQAVKTGEKQFNSTNNIDYTTIINGIDVGNKEKNIKINSLAYGGMEDLYIAAYKAGTANGYVEPALSIPCDAEAKYANSLREKGYEVYANVVACKPADFEKTWSRMLDEFLNAGGMEVLNQRRAAWRADKK